MRREVVGSAAQGLQPNSDHHAPHLCGGSGYSYFRSKYLQIQRYFLSYFTARVARKSQWLSRGTEASEASASCLVAVEERFLQVK